MAVQPINQVRMLEIDGQTFAKGPYWLTDIHAYSEIMHFGMAVVWAVISKTRMSMYIYHTLLVEQTQEEKNLWTERLLKYMSMWMEKDIGISPREIEIYISERSNETPSMKRFKNIRARKI
jgi:hypothetical protein